MSDHHLNAMLSDAYDGFEYDAGISKRCHPWYIGGAASLFGHVAPKVRSARILEIGCASGHNLLAIAASLPDAVCVGVDISSKQIQRAQRDAAALGLDHVAFIAADVMSIKGELGGFDYIISHGVYSWVPDAVRDGLFELCADLLAPGGLLYMSYNTMPGWADYGLMRALVKRLAPGEAWSSELNARVDAWVDALPEGSTRKRYEQLWRHGFRDLPEFYKRHGVFAEFNEPRYVNEVARHAAESGLDYVSDLSLKLDLPTAAYRDVVDRSQHLTRLEQLQMLDFAQHTTFRASVFCAPRDRGGVDPTHSRHAERTDLLSALELTSISRLAVTPNLIVASSVDQAQRDTAHELYPHVEPHDDVKYYQRRDRSDLNLIPMPPSAGRDLIDAAIGLWPEPLSLREHLERIGTSDERSVSDVLSQLISLLTYEDADLIIDAPAHTPDTLKAARLKAARPEISAYNRYQLRRGTRHLLTSTRHKTVSAAYDDPWLEFADLFDGARERVVILAEVTAHPRYQGSALSALDEAARATRLEVSLGLFQQLGLLV